MRIVHDVHVRVLGKCGRSICFTWCKFLQFSRRHYADTPVVSSAFFYPSSGNALNRRYPTFLPIFCMVSTERGSLRIQLGRPDWALCARLKSRHPASRNGGFYATAQMFHKIVYLGKPKIIHGPGEISAVARRLPAESAMCRAHS